MDIREAETKIKGLTNQAAVREKKYRARFGESGALGIEVRNWAATHAEKLREPVVGPIGLEVRRFYGMVIMVGAAGAYIYFCLVGLSLSASLLL